LTTSRTRARGAVKYLHELADQTVRSWGPPSEVEPAQAECRRLRDLLYAIIDGRVEVTKKTYATRSKRR
jgi:hypothetical protein